MRTAYRIKPRFGARAWWAIVGVAVILLGAPAVINAAVPDAAPVMSRVELGSEDYGWTIGMRDRDGSELVCEQHFDDPMTERWTCGQTEIRTTVVENAEDQDLALRRIIRGVGVGWRVLDENVPLRHRAEARQIEDTAADATAISLEGSGEHRDQTIMVVVSGPDRMKYSDLVWHNVTSGGRS
ncbi:hypothetical protein [Kocuria sp. TGY1127_2]|uniref:hypothetical protein n=1 Tax=Kocuria sp. TGY1127_2 TaxID=2711328 RepID=UPI0015BF742B|nr:hypothetical protein [Kocuria sp. TGY1127_2]